MAAGRPTRYDKTYHPEHAYKYALLGAIGEQIADLLDIGYTTFNNWLKKHKEFREAVKAGRDIADAEVVHSLFHRAKGYSHPEDKIFYDSKSGDTVVVPTTKHYPPDATSAIFWLKNRRPEEWRDVKRIESKSDINVGIGIVAISGINEFLVEAADGHAGANLLQDLNAQRIGQAGSVLPAEVPDEEAGRGESVVVREDPGGTEEP